MGLFYKLKVNKLMKRKMFGTVVRMENLTEFTIPDGVTFL